MAVRRLVVSGDTNAAGNGVLNLVESCGFENGFVAHSVALELFEREVLAGSALCIEHVEGDTKVQRSSEWVGKAVGAGGAEEGCGIGAEFGGCGCCLGVGRNSGKEEWKRQGKYGAGQPSQEKSGIQHAQNGIMRFRMCKVKTARE